MPWYDSTWFIILFCLGMVFIGGPLFGWLITASMQQIEEFFEWLDKWLELHRR